MKKLLLLCVSILSANFLLAQGGTVGVTSSPLEVEVGQANTFTFVFNPLPPSTSTTLYSLAYWTITAPVSGNIINGNINGQNVNTYQYTQSSGTNVSASSPSVITATITFGDQAPRFSTIASIAVGSFRDASGGFTGTIGAPGTYPVRVHTIKAPTISPASILDCSNDNVQICATDYDDADSFTWTITGGTIASGQGSSCITVTPNVNGNITATCLVKRVNGLSNYTATSTKTITRSVRSISYTISPVQDYICKSSGIVFQYPNQSGMTSVAWNAPNCTVSAETITNGIRQVTITPNAASTIGSIVSINVTANFIGGCTATSPSTSFKILDSTAPPIPAGNFDVSLPENESSICTTTRLNLAFIPSNGFTNGVTTISPSFLWGEGDPIHYKPNKATSVTVCNKNLCTGVTNCKVFSVFPPAPCASSRIASVESTVSPNPSTGTFKFSLPETTSGTYQVYDQNSILVQESKFSNQNELQIELSSKSQSGIYIVKVITEKKTFTEKIIISDY